MGPLCDSSVSWNIPIWYRPVAKTPGTHFIILVLQYIWNVYYYIYLLVTLGHFSSCPSDQHYEINFQNTLVNRYDVEPTNLWTLSIAYSTVARGTTQKWSGGRFKNRALKFSHANIIYSFQCMAKYFRVEFQVPLEIPDEIYYPYIEIYDFYTALKF